MIDFCGVCSCCLFPCFLVVCHSNWCIVSGLFLSEHLTCISMDQTLKVQTLIYWSWPAGRMCMFCLKSALLCPIHSLELAMKPQKQSQVRVVILSFVLFCFVRFFSPCNQLSNIRRHTTGHCLLQARVLEKYSECNKGENQCLSENTGKMLYNSVLKTE